MSDVFFPKFELLKADPKLFKNQLLADTFYNMIQKHITKTQARLKRDEQLIALFVADTGEQITITHIGYQNPYLMILYGIDSSSRECNILAHMNSVQLVLKIDKVEASRERRQIVFLNT